MELDQLKQMWQEQSAPETEGLKEIIGKKSNSPIARMKRSLIFELILVIIAFGSIVLYYFMTFSGKFQIVAWLYLVIGLIFIVYFYFKYKLLNEMECMSCQVASNLSNQVRTLEKFTRFYLIAGTAIVPLVLIFFYFFEMVHFPMKGGFFRLPSEQVSVMSSVAFLLMVIVIFTVPIYFLNKWYIRKLYGQHIERLKQMLRQIS